MRDLNTLHNYQDYLNAVKENDLFLLFVPEKFITVEMCNVAIQADSFNMDCATYCITELIPRQKLSMLTDNSADWFVATLASGDFELCHQSSLSSILECGDDMFDYGFASLDRCGSAADVYIETGIV